MAETDTKERKNPEDPKETMDAKETKEGTSAKTPGEAEPAKTEANGIRPADSMDNGRPPDDYSKLFVGPITGSTKIEGLRLDFNFCRQNAPILYLRLIIFARFQNCTSIIDVIY